MSDETKVISTDEKLEFRNAQVKALIARNTAKAASEAAASAEKEMYAVLQNFATKLEIDSKEYNFNVDSLTFEKLK